MNAGEANNTASMQFTVGTVAPPPAPGLPDLSISPADMTVSPSSPVDGQPAVISAVVSNIGTLEASAVVISFYDGDPSLGGLLIGSVSKPVIEAGAATVVEITWDTYGHAGMNYIHVIIDPQGLISEHIKTITLLSFQ